MRTGQAKSVELSITREGEVRHFELRLPRRLIRITGIEAGTKFTDPAGPVIMSPEFLENLEFVPARVMGELRMQDLGRGGTFFSTHVREEESQMGFGDFSVSPHFKPFVWTRMRRREMENIGVTTDKGIVFGFYRDLFGQALGQNFSYRVKVQLWYEIIKPTEP